MNDLSPCGINLTQKVILSRESRITFHIEKGFEQRPLNKTEISTSPEIDVALGQLRGKAESFSLTDGDVIRFRDDVIQTPDQRMDIAANVPENPSRRDAIRHAVATGVMSAMAIATPPVFAQHEPTSQSEKRSGAYEIPPNAESLAVTTLFDVVENGKRLQRGFVFDALTGEVVAMKMAVPVMVVIERDDHQKPVASKIIGKKTILFPFEILINGENSVSPSFKIGGIHDGVIQDLLVEKKLSLHGMKEGETIQPEVYESAAVQVLEKYYRHLQQVQERSMKKGDTFEFRGSYGFNVGRMQIGFEAFEPKTLASKSSGPVPSEIWNPGIATEKWEPALDAVGVDTTGLISDDPDIPDTIFEGITYINAAEDRIADKTEDDVIVPFNPSNYGLSNDLQFSIPSKGGNTNKIVVEFPNRALSSKGPYVFDLISPLGPTGAIASDADLVEMALHAEAQYFVDNFPSSVDGTPSPGYVRGVGFGFLGQIVDPGQLGQENGKTVANLEYDLGLILANTYPGGNYDGDLNPNGLDGHPFGDMSFL